MKPHEHILPQVAPPRHSHLIRDIEGLTAALAASPTPTEYDVHNVATADAHFGTSGGGSMYLGNNVDKGGTVDDTSKAQWRIVQSQSSDNVRIDRSPAGATFTPATVFALDNAGTPTFAGLAGTGTRMVVTSSTGVLSTQAIPSGGSGISRSVVSVTSAVTLGATALTDYVAFVGASGAPTLPTAVGNTNRYTVKNVHLTNKTLATTSSQTIDGSTTATIIPNQSLEVVSDGANWQII